MDDSVCGNGGGGETQEGVVSEKRRLRRFFLSHCAMLDTHKEHIKIRVYDTESGVIGLSITTNLGNVVEMIVDGPSFRKWMGGELIQRCFPEMDVELRELLISGMDMETQEEFFCDGD
jgi:hypothetical protein